MRRASAAWAFAVALLITISVAYAPSLDGAYVWDDHVLVEDDARCRNDLLQCFSIPFLPTGPFIDVAPSYYRPLVTASFAIGGGARFQHGWNIALHALNAVLLLALLLRYRAPPLRAFALSLLWALHPRLVEAVTWVSGRTDVLCATFVLGALVTWPTKADHKRGLFTALLLLAGLFTKEVAVAAIVALAFLTWQTKPRAMLGWLALSVLVYTPLRLAVVGIRTPPSSLAPGQRLPTVLEALARYSEMLGEFWAPWSGRGAIGRIDPIRVGFGVLVTMGIAYWVFRARRGSRGVVLGTALAVTSLLAVVHIVPIGLHGAVTGDRLLYLPFAGVILTIGCALPKMRAELPSVVVILVVAMVEGVFLRRAVHAFDDEIDLWLVLVERADPENAGPRSALATVVRDRGAADLACQLFDSTRQLLVRTSRGSTPAHRRASENLAACWSTVGRYDDSAFLFRDLASAYPRAGRIQLGLGYAELHRLDFAAASAAFARAAELDEELRPMSTQMGEAVKADQRQIGALDADLPRKARYLANVGRGVEAEKAWLSVALDGSAPRPVRLEALRYLAEDGSPASAERALVAVGERALQVRIDQRIELLQTVEVRRGRISRCCGVVP